jgi:hypothetical protein
MHDFSLFSCKHSKCFDSKVATVSDRMHTDSTPGTSGGARSRNLGGHLRGKLIFWGGKIEFLKRYCYTATGGRIS